MTFTPPPLRAYELPQTQLSRFLETQIQKRVEDEVAKRAKVRAPAAAAKALTPGGQASGARLADVERPGAITIRVVMAQDSELYAREGMLKAYADKYPKSFNMVSKVRRGGGGGLVAGSGCVAIVCVAGKRCRQRSCLPTALV
jgi:hypothetical protein